jgi:hypothetical protein
MSSNADWQIAGISDQNRQKVPANGPLGETWTGGWLAVFCSA